MHYYSEFYKNLYTNNQNSFFSNEKSFDNINIKNYIENKKSNFNSYNYENYSDENFYNDYKTTKNFYEKNNIYNNADYDSIFDALEERLCREYNCSSSLFN